MHTHIHVARIPFWAPVSIAVALLGLIGCAEQTSPAGEGRAAIPANTEGDATGNEEAIDFNRDIRPILSDKCFACHGPDAKVAQDAGGFRLDSFETATAPASSGATPIVPGDPGASELLKRITHTSGKLRMPPASTNLTVTDEEADLLRRWIEQGAEYQGHWAYQTPTMPEPPDVVNEDWARNNIDHFIAARLEQAGLSPSKEADRATLIRRASLDLIGLPPTPEEIDAFVNDDAPDAYDRLLDRLLASPHFGERMAVVWLDAARYGDTNGFHHDNIRTAWPWRQWVIEQFNKNTPYDQFVIEQLAGDLLPDATKEQVLASGFCRMHNINDEGGALDAEYRVEAIADRIETIATVFMAQTYTCARCHDHKYDPIAQEDYFATWAYFNSVDQERGVYPNNFTQARAYPPNMLWTTPEQEAALADAEARRSQAAAKLNKTTPALAAEQRHWEQDRRDHSRVNWAEAQLTAASSTHAGTKLERKPDGSVLLAGEAPDQEDITLTLRTDATALRLIRLDALTDPSLKDTGVGRAPNGNAVLTRFTVRAVSVADPTKSQDVGLRYAWADVEQPNGDFDILNTLREDGFGWALGGHLDDAPRTALFVADQPFGYQGGTEIQITLHHRSRYAKHTLGRVRIGVASAGPSVLDELPTVSRDWFEAGPFPASFDKAYATRFGPEDATDTNPNGAAFAGKRWVHRPNYADGQVNPLRGENRAFYLGRSIFTPVERNLNLSLGSDDAIQVYLNGEEVLAKNVKRGAAADQEKIAITLRPGENTLVLKIINAGSGGGFYYRAREDDASPSTLQPLALIDADQRVPGADRRLAEDWRARHSETYRELHAAVAAIDKEIADINAMAVPVLIMKEAAQPTPAYILERGAYDKPIKDRAIERRPPTMVNLPLPEGAPNNRLGFAQWLVRPDHPLTARVHVNRLWQTLFGTGIVKTVEDFGSQADWPSHPELLDYLAVRLVESGWDQKALLKLIMTSATYRQQAVTQSAALGIDADNRLLSHFPRRRLQAEFIRDQALYVAGLLDDQIGGPSVRPYQPGNLWNEVAIGSSNTMNFKRGGIGDLYRRSMYTFWKKTSPPPQMQIFNAPTREFCVVNRDTTNTPLQVLTLWNDEQFLEAARVLAQHTVAESDNDDARLTLIYRRCTGQTPGAEALAVLRKMLGYYQERYANAPDDARALLRQGEHPLPEQHDPAELASWMMVASAVLSLDETIVRD